MSTIYQTAAERALDEIPDDQIGALRKMQRRIKEGQYGWQGDIFGQSTYWRGNDLAWAAAFYAVWSHWLMGNIEIATLHIGEEPGIDADVDGNNAKLKRLADGYEHEMGLGSIPKDAISAEFWGGAGDHDGQIVARAPIVMSYADCISIPNTSGTTERSGWFALEVGDQHPAKTLIWLQGGNQLARWPYGSKCVYLLRGRMDHPMVARLRGSRR